MKPYIRTIPITTSASPDYSIGDCVGTTFKIEPQAFSGQGIKMQTLVATDQSNQGPALRILFNESNLPALSASLFDIYPYVLSQTELTTLYSQ